MQLEQLGATWPLILLLVSGNLAACGGPVAQQGARTKAERAATAIQAPPHESRHPSGRIADYISNPSLWQTPPIRPQGFQFEIQISSLGTAYDIERVKKSIRNHALGEYESAVSSTAAAEWGYSFTHLDGESDGAGRRIEAGYPTPPTNRADCLAAIGAFLQRQYVSGAQHPWASMNGHYPWHHYAAEFGFDQIGSEIGENINNYQWHIALTRGAARQYGKPWFIDFSAWHGPSITDYCQARIWGRYSGVDHGHSMSLFERSLFMSYMSGADQITAEAGGALCFLTDLDEDGNYRLSPYGEVCRRFRRFSLEYPDPGITYTPLAIVLDFYHGAYSGFGGRRAFHHFDYTRGDQMTWNLVNLFWPGGWEVMGKQEVGVMVNGPYGDTCDVLLQNAPQDVLDSYPCVILSGEIALSSDQVARFRQYARQGGTLILNTAYLRYFPEIDRLANDTGPRSTVYSEGKVIVYGPDYQTDQLDNILRDQLRALLPVSVSTGIQYILNIKPGSVLVTLINNDGVTKQPRSKPVVDTRKQKTVVVRYLGRSTVRNVRLIKASRPCPLENGREVSVTIPPGELSILEFTIDRDRAGPRSASATGRQGPLGVDD